MDKFFKLSGTIGKYPYDHYRLYPSIINNRKYLSLSPIDKNGKMKHKPEKKKFLQYARYLVSVKLGRELTEYEEVDHIDNDKTNDDISNLQILTPHDNRSKGRLNKKIKYVIFKCPWCQKCYIKHRRETHLAKGGIYTSCSRKCSRKFQTMYLQNPFSDKVEKRLEENIIMEFTTLGDPFS